MARLPTKQSELSILRSFANMPDDVMSGTPSDYVTRAILPKANDFSARGSAFGPNGMPPFNNSPILDQALSSGLPFRQAAQAAGNIAGTNVKSEMDNVVRAAQDTPESRAMSAAAEIMKKYPGAATGLTSLMPYEIVLDKYASSFGIDKEDIERAIEKAKSRADETAFPDVPIEYAPITGTPKLTPKSSFDIPAPQTDRAIGIPATFTDEDILDPEGAGTGPTDPDAADYAGATDDAGAGEAAKSYTTFREDATGQSGAFDESTPSHVGLSSSEMFESLAREKLGPDVSQPNRLQSVLRGQSHALGMWIMAVLKKHVPASAISGVDPETSEFPAEGIDPGISEYHYWKYGAPVKENDPEVQRLYKAFRKASKIGYRLGNAEGDLMSFDWDEEDEFADLSRNQKEAIGTFVNNSLRLDRGYEKALVDFMYGRTGRGSIGGIMLNASNNTYQYWENEGVRRPQQPARGYIDFYEETLEGSGKKTEKPDSFIQGG